ncbi:625c08a4-fe8c-469f-928d-9da2e8c454b4 [Sclerotinia trifoliorum]|uniref:625c08a4-fe8c-469f-928d-9da2e8c454b4 n=1 Tax=Sclerotinia trifoliorum TaxID=28548 RepID=A0A8H2ZKI3_9HELO|nr:625c08a4-fe8c-469f-928d-9da2e8c454b4 [Sclerotinia trifoliorum]
MRRPPDKDGHSAMTERDVVSSNATLNAFFGGSRQKSWMLAGGAPVRPTPRRPSITKPSDQSNSDTQRGSTANLISPVASNESSSPGPAHNSVPLNTHTAAVSGSHGPPRVNATLATSQALQKACTTPSNIDIVQPQTLPDASRGEIDEARTVEISARSPPSDKSPQPQTAVSTTSIKKTTHDIPSRSSSVQKTSNRAPSVTTGDSVTVPMMPGNVDQTSLSHAQHPPRRGFQPTMPSLKSRVELVKRYVEHCGGMANLNSALEKPRFSLMETACNSDDAHYVAIHQLFCVWDTNRKDVTSIPGLPDSVTLSHAFRILGQLIRDNEGMAPIHLRWFAKFPSPLVDLIRTSEPYRRIIHEVGTFLSKLASTWPDLTRLCTSRGYPPLVDELINQLGLLSPTLQNIVFTATRRNLNIIDDEFGNQMERVFEQDRTGHRELAARYHTSRPPTEKEIQERSKIIAERYRMISQKSRQKKLANIAPVPSTTAPAVPSNTGQIPVAANGSYPLPNGSGLVSNPNTFRQRNDVRNRQVGQNLGQIRTSFTGPPLPSNLISVGGNHPNNTPRAAADTPSPIPMQGLSMGSPMQQAFQYASPVLQNNGPQFSPSVIRNNGTQSPVIAHNQGIQGQYCYDPRYDPRQQTYHPQQHLQQFGQQGQYGANNPQQMSLQQIQQAQMQQLQQLQLQQQQQWLQRSMPVDLQQNNQHQMSQQQQALSMQRPVGLRIDSNPTNGQQQQQVPSRNVSRNGSRNNSSSSERTLPSMNSSSHTQNLTQGFQIPPCPRPMSIEEQQRRIYGMTDPMKRPLIPPLGFMHPQGIPDPYSNALHQADVRSPRLVTVNVSQGGTTARRFYQFVKNFPMSPRKIPFELALNKLEFHIPADALKYISRDRLIGKDPLMVREVGSKSLQYRLRCSSDVADTDAFPVSRWVVSDTVWPDVIFMDINGNELEIRRKQHHGKDLPVDVTPYIHAGINVITISMPKLTTAIKQKEYFIAVEEIEILQHGEIMDICKEQRIPAATVVEEIKKKLAVPTEEDDELLIVASDLSVSLTDPFTSRIFEIPVRGKDCLHRECFDLATFLLTRISKPKRPEQPSMIDIWKCPLCSADARPYSLQLDEFMASVRDELQAQDNLEVKSILVAADGTWRAKPEPQPSHKRKSTTGGDDDDDESIDGSRPSKKSTNGAKIAVVEIIELDDD